jgi:hypothetical protein
MSLPGGIYRAEISYEPEPGRVSIALRGEAVPPVRLALTWAGGGAAPDDLLFGRDRRRGDSFPLWSSDFSDLWVIAGPAAPPACCR